MFNNHLIFKMIVCIFFALIFGYRELKQGRYIEFIARVIFVFAFAQAIVLFSQSQK